MEKRAENAPHSHNGYKESNSPAQRRARGEDPFIIALLSLRPFLFKYACTLVPNNKDDAHDLVQTALAKALGARKSFGATGKKTNLQAWLFCILRNAYFTRLRHSKVAVKATALLASHALELQTRGPHCGPSQYHSVYLAEILAQMNRLPPKMKQAIVMTAIEEKSLEETARIVGVPVNTIKSRVSRGRKALSQIVEEGKLPRRRGYIASLE